MLPGFRFLFAATLLTISTLVFGLGAAALLRASHDRFASLPKQPVPAPVFLQTADAVVPTLSMLRVDKVPESQRSVEAPAVPEPVVTPQFDTLLPTDRIATLSIARVGEPIPAPVAVAPTIAIKPDVTADIKAEPPTVEIKIEAQIETKVEAEIDAKIEPTSENLPEPPVQIAAGAVAPPVETAIATPGPATAPAEPVAIAGIEMPTRIEADVVAAPEPVPEQAAAPEPEITGTIPNSAPQVSIEPPLVNARPLRRPPVPRDRPATAGIVAALPEPAAAAPAVKTDKPVMRKRKPVVKRATKPKPSVVTRTAPRRPARRTPNPTSPFGGSPFGATSFGVTPFGT